MLLARCRFIRYQMYERLKMNEQKYNGWTNYETWNCMLWIDNTEGDREFWDSRATKILQENSGERDESAKVLLEEIRERIEASIPIEANSMYSDLLNAAISEINFYEIAESILSDTEYETEQTEDD